MPATRENKKGETRSDKEQKAEPGQERDNLLTRPQVQESHHDLRPLLPLRQVSSHTPSHCPNAILLYVPQSYHSGEVRRDLLRARPQPSGRVR